MSSGVQDLFRLRNDVEHRNWYAVGCAVNQFLSDGLRKYAETKMKELHALLTTKVGGPGVGCTCKCTPGMKRSPHGRTTACLWAKELRKFHIFKKRSNIPWHQSDSNKWHDPVDGYWEIAKLFMSGLGDDFAKVKDPSSTDIAPLLNLFRFCKHFKVQNALLKAVTDWRNMWAHAPYLKISDSDKKAAFQDIKLLMKDPELVASKEIQECSPLIKKAEEADLVVLEENQLRIIQEYRRIKECEVKMAYNIWNKTIAIFTVVLFLMSRPWLKIPAVLRWFFAVILLLSRVGEKGRIVSDDGCSSAVIKSPISHFHFQQFDFSSYLAYKREGFVGRNWFFMKLENIFDTDKDATGVLITGEPGSGKTALISQLICSQYSRIHENIIGYHLCEYSEKGKRDGARFVRNLVDQIAARMPDYSQYVEKNEQIRRELDKHCQQDPTSCFFTSILGPLRELNPPSGLRFIVLDALDECFERDKTSEIMEILHNKILHFPKWLKVILTSRNFTAVTTRMPQVVRRTPLYPTDTRNVEDIREYVSRFLSQNSFFVERLLTAMNIGSRRKVMKLFLEKVITRAEGNFLFVKMTLQYINDTVGGFELQSMPTSLFDLYTIFFNRQFDKGGFRPFIPLFEVLLAACSPLHLDDVEEILRREYDTEDVHQLTGQASCFLRFGHHDGTVRIYHKSFAEWLINQTTVIHINKTRGHQNIAKFLLQRLRERHGNATFDELTELFMHVLSGKTLDMHGEAMDLFNITEIREPQTNRSILHHLATKPHFYVPVLDFFVRKFKTVDMLDASKKTPAFYAAYLGFAENLKSFINGGAVVSSFLEGFTELNPVALVVRNTGIEEFSLMHGAAAKGHADVVELLIKSNVSFLESSKNYPTALHLAAGNGHLDVVRSFYSSGAKFDVIALHHAAARRHLEVVEFLLKTVGIRDRCLLCLCKPEHLSKSNPTVQDVHLYFCETALHAAVSRGHVDVVKLLLSFGKESLECHHHSGKTVLMDAVERNDSEMVDLLLANGANVTTKCGMKMPRRSKRRICTLSSMYEHDFMYTMYCIEDSCNCGNRAIHISARYGLWQMTEKLISGRVFDLTDVDNCRGRHALNIAIEHGHTHFLDYTNKTYKNNGYHLLDSALVTGAVTQHCSVNAVKHILNYPINYIYEHRWELLLLVIDWFPGLFYRGNEISPNICPEAFEDEDISLELWIQTISEKRVAIMKLLIESYEEKSVIINKKDAAGMTLLHHAVRNGFEDAVKYLVEIGADTRVKYRDGESPLKLALNLAPYNPPNNAWYRCYTSNDRKFGSCSTTNYDEVVRYLIWSQNWNILNCDTEIESVLHMIIVKQMPLSLYAFLKAGVDMHCKAREGWDSPFLRYLRVGGRRLSEVFKIYGLEVSSKCGQFFSSSELHLMFYLSPSGDMGNFFRPVDKGLSPLQRLIDQHPEGLGMLEKCYDKEGYLPIHRAVQGGNIAAIKWSKGIGVNTHLKTRSGLTALDISILYLGDTSKTESNFILSDWQHRIGEKVTSKHRNEVFEELLRTFFNTSPEYSSEFPCGPSLKELSPLHIAAVKGMKVLKYVHKKAATIFPSLPLNCVNKHRLDPVYIAHFYESLRNEALNDKCSKDSCVNTWNVSKKFKKFALKIGSNWKNSLNSCLPFQYPVQEVDYHMAFNYLYPSSSWFYGQTDKALHCGMPPDVRITDCPGYNKIIPKFEESVPPVDFTECSKITVNRGCYQLLCQKEIFKNHLRRYSCPILIKRLRMQFMFNPRRNGQISRFIAKRFGWEDVPEVKDVKNRWPLFFLHKKIIKKYASFEYLEVLYKAFEVTDARFRDDLIIIHA